VHLGDFITDTFQGASTYAPVVTAGNISQSGGLFDNTQQSGIPAWAWIAGGLVLVMIFSSGRHR
jgi:hypothetical protein